MVTRRPGALVATLCVGALALVACGTQVDGDLPVTVGPTVPTEADDASSATRASDVSGTAGPTATPPDAAAAETTTSGEVRGGDRGAGASSATAGADAGSARDGTTSDGTAGESPPAATDPDLGAGETASTPAETTAPGGDPSDAVPGFAAPGELLRRAPTGAVQLLLDDLRLGRHDGFDRVVLDLSGAGEVGWRAEYVAHPALDGSGMPVDLAGPAVLVVGAEGMAYPEPGDTRYDGGVQLVEGGELQTVTEVLRDTPFEGRLQVYVGVSDEAPFRVFRLDAPERLVIDIQH